MHIGVLVEVLEEDELNRPTRIRVIAHSRNRDDIYERLENIENKKHVATFYTGRIPEKGYAVALINQNEVAKKRLAEIRLNPFIQVSDKELNNYLEKRGIKIDCGLIRNI